MGDFDNACSLWGVDKVDWSSKPITQGTVRAENAFGVMKVTIELEIGSYLLNKLSNTERVCIFSNVTRMQTNNE